MRTRIHKGTLVASTTVMEHIKSKRLIIEVIYTSSFKVKSKKVKGIRKSLLD
jgi:hypothetical protein